MLGQKPTAWASHSPWQSLVKFSSHRMLHVWDSVPALLCSGKSDLTSGLQSHPTLTVPVDVPHGCQVSWMQYSAASRRGAPFSSPPSLGFSNQKRAPTPRPFFLSRQSVHASTCRAWGRVCPAASAHSCPVTDHGLCCLSQQLSPRPLHQRSWYNQLPIL